MDQYHNHIYVSLILHILEENDEIKNLVRDDSIYDGQTSKNGRQDSRMSLLDHGHRQGSSYLEAHRALRKMKLSVVIEQVSVILLPDDTLITIFQHSGKSVYKLILERINQPKTILRSSKDASLLMEAVIDTIVDLAIPIIDSYRHQIYELEGKLLIIPKMNYMHELHMITGELTLLKKTLAPIKGLVTILRKHSDEKSLITPLAKVYFSDVSTMIKMGENLVNMIFNLIAYETNENMKLLALLSLIFLPMTFIAGYYGMNFEVFPDLFKPISYFWWATGLSTSLIVVGFTYRYWSNWILRFWKYLQNKKLQKKLRNSHN
ncbi:6812_t:CDS:2 [Diversispora eburnea]|uniref:6812_t:CDS:1 n=1 Tax=Diversispora eburnea TaxID=1213867 RepID=A0A9N8Z0I4_9GLOM|nr:6812_t:CDS:2 [Diversispora eburnea]